MSKVKFCKQNFFKNHLKAYEVTSIFTIYFNTMTIWWSHETVLNLNYHARTQGFRSSPVALSQANFSQAKWSPIKVSSGNFSFIDGR